MAQEHQEENTVDLATHSIRRKRGRPRKDDVPGSEPYKRTRRCKMDGEAHENDPFVGQVVSGVLDGKFDAGYMLTVQVGERGGVLRGVVFEPGLSVPISAANDIAPNVKMFKRDEVSLPSSTGPLPCFTPIRSRNDGTFKYRKRNESAVSSKGTCKDMVAEDLNAVVQVHSAADNSRRLPENDSSYIHGNLKQELESNSDDHVGTECSRDILLSKAVGNPSKITSESSKIVLPQEISSDAKPIAHVSLITSETNQASLSDSRPRFICENKTPNVQGIANDIKLTAQMSPSTSELEQKAETSNAGLVFTNDNKTAHLHKVITDAKPAIEDCQIETFECKLPAETSTSGPLFTNSAPDNHGKAPPPVTGQISENMSEMVADLVEATRPTEPSVDDLCAEQSVNLASEDEAVRVACLGEALYATVRPVNELGVQCSVKLASEDGTVQVTDLGEAPHKTVLPVDELGVQHSVKLALENGAVQVDDLGEAPHTTEPSADELGVHRSVKLPLEDGTVEAGKQMNDHLGKESGVPLEPLAFKSNKPVEPCSKLPKNDTLAPEVIPARLQSDLASPSVDKIEVCPIAAGEATHSCSQID